MRRRDRQVTKERVVFVIANELDRLVHDLIVRIRLSGSTAVITWEQNFLAVSNQVRRIKRMRVDLIVIAEKDIESMFFRDPR